MKRYLLVVMTIGMMGANAQSNPFDLQKNLQKIDKDQDILLSTLKEMTDKKDVLTNPEVPKVLTEELQNKKEDEIVNVPSEEVVEDNILSDELNRETTKKRASGSIEESQVEPIEESLESKIEQKKLEMERLKQIALQKEKTEALKREEEKLEVASHEAKRAKRATIKMVEENIQIEIEQKKEAIADINISQETIDERNEADKAYLEAVREMDSVN